MRERSLANYQERRDEFEQALSGATSQQLRETLFTVLAHLDVCAEIYTELAPALRAYLQWIRSLAERNQQHATTLVSAIRDQMARAESIEDPALRRTASESAQALAAHGGSQQEAAGNLVDVATTVPEIIANLIHVSLFEGLLASRDGKHAVNAVISFLDFLAGFSPLGPFIAGLQKISEILSARSKEVRLADDYLNSLELFILAAFNWAVAAHCAIHSLSAAGAVDSSIFIEQSVNDVGERIQRRLRGASPGGTPHDTT